MRTIPGAAPRSMKTNPNSAAARERAAKARAVAIEVMQRDLDLKYGKDKAPKVLDRDATAADIRQLTEGIGK